MFTQKDLPERTWSVSSLKTFNVDVRTKEKVPRPSVIFPTVPTSQLLFIEVCEQDASDFCQYNYCNYCYSNYL